MILLRGALKWAEVPTVAGGGEEQASGVISNLLGRASWNVWLNAFIDADMFAKLGFLPWIAAYLPTGDN